MQFPKDNMIRKDETLPTGTKEILRDVIKSNLNVRQTDLLIKKELNNKDKKNNKNFKRDINILDFEKSLSLATGLTVTIKDKNGIYIKDVYKT